MCCLYQLIAVPVYREARHSFIGMTETLKMSSSLAQNYRQLSFTTTNINTIQLFRLVLLALNVLCCAKQFHSLILCTLITGSDRLKSSLRERKQPIINQRFVTFLLKWLATVIYLFIFDQYVLIRYQKCFSFAYDRIRY